MKNIPYSEAFSFVMSELMSNEIFDLAAVLDANFDYQIRYDHTNMVWVDASGSFDDDTRVYEIAEDLINSADKLTIVEIFSVLKDTYAVLDGDVVAYKE